MTRLVDRMGISRLVGYNETMYSGAEQISSMGPNGQTREGVPANLVRHAREVYKSNGPVFACASVRQWILSEARFQFQRQIDKKLYGTADLSILEEPWPNADSGELWTKLENGDTTAGNAYVRSVEPTTPEEMRLLMLRPDLVTIVSAENHDTDGNAYKIPIGYIEDVRPLGIDADPQFYTVEQVAHYSPTPDPDAMWRGMSWLSPIIREIRGDDAITTYRQVHLDTGAMPGMVVKYARKLKDETVETLRKRLEAKHAGPLNAGKVLVLDEGADLTVAGSTLEQLQLEALTHVGERRICAAGGPGLDVILGFAPGDYQSAIRRFADVWARPHWRMACASLQHLVPNVPLTGVRLWFDVSGIAALREGELQRGQTTLVKMQGVETAVQSGFTRASAVAAAESGDITLLVEDPNAPTPGMAGRVTESEKFGGQGGAPGQPTALPGPGAPPAKSQNLPGKQKPRVPGAKPPVMAPALATPAGRDTRQALNGSHKG